DDFLSRVHPEDVERKRAALFDALREGKAFTIDHRIVRCDGSIRVLHTRGAVIEDARGNRIRMAGACWDITDMTEGTQARERLLSLLHATLEASADGILVVDRVVKISLQNERLQ